MYCPHVENCAERFGYRDFLRKKFEASIQPIDIKEENSITKKILDVMAQHQSFDEFYKEKLKDTIVVYDDPSGSHYDCKIENTFKKGCLILKIATRAEEGSWR